MRAHGDIEQAIDEYGDTVWRAIAVYLPQKADAQDAFQDTFLKFALSDRVFEGPEHRKAWLIRVASNVCKDMLKAAHRKALPLEGPAVAAQCVQPDAAGLPGSLHQSILDAMRALDDPPRTPVYLALYEGYSAVEIADMVGSPVNTVYSWIARGKKTLREVLA